MRDVSHLLMLASQCRDLEKTAVEPEIIEQLGIWATELTKMVEDLECRTVEHGLAE